MFSIHSHIIELPNSIILHRSTVYTRSQLLHHAPYVCASSRYTSHLQKKALLTHGLTAAISDEEMESDGEDVILSKKPVKKQAEPEEAGDDEEPAEEDEYV